MGNFMHIRFPRGPFRAFKGERMSNSNLNKIILLGNLGRDPQLRTTGKGNSVVTLSLATNRNIKTADGGERTETSWHRATVWGKMGEACVKYLTKGSRVYLEGVLQMKDWKDKEGIARKSAEINVDSIKFLSGMKSSGSTVVEEVATVQ